MKQLSTHAALWALAAGLAAATPFGVPAFAFVAAAGAVSLLLLARSRDASTPTESDQIPELHHLQRHLEWCRRRGEPAHVLWVHLDIGAPARAGAAMDVFRITDSVALIRESGTYEIVAMLDDMNFEREGLERRLEQSLGYAPQLGWAEFPDEGVTLDVLFEQARSHALHPDSTPIVTQLPAASERVGSPVRRLARGSRAASPASRVPLQSSNQG